MRTLFLLTTLVACWLGYQAHLVRQRAALVAWLTSRTMYEGYHGGTVELVELTIQNGFVRISPDVEKSIPRLWLWLGAEETGDLRLLRLDLTDGDLDRVRHLLPECSVTTSVHPLRPKFEISAGQ